MPGISARVCAGLLCGGLLPIASPVMAQNAEETISVGLEVQVSPAPQITRLDDIVATIDGNSNPNQGIQWDIDPFCLSIGKRSGEFTIRTIGQNVSSVSSDPLIVRENESGSGFAISYILRISASTTSPFNTVHTAHSRDSSTTMEAFDFRRGDEPDCGGGDNANLSIFNQRTNGDALAFVPAGQTYSFTDQVTIIIEDSI